MKEQNETENKFTDLVSSEIKSVASPIVTDITMSKESIETDSKINLITVNKSKRVFVKNEFIESDDLMLNDFKEMEFKELAGENIVCKTGIDKGDFSLDVFSTIKEYLIENEVGREELEFYRKGSSKFFKHKGLSFKLAGGDKELIVGVVTVPTAHGGLETCLATLRTLLPEASYKSLRVTRLDYDIVIKGLSHKELNRRLIVDRVKSISVYRYQSKELTRYHGLKPFMTVIYHMLKRHGVDAVKIEVRSWGKNIGVKHPDEIRDWLLNGEFNPFESVKILNYDFQSNDRKRMIQFNCRISLKCTRRFPS